MACAYGRYGYRRVTALLRNAGWRVNHKRVERIWRQEGLKVPQRQPKRRRLWLNDGSCIRLRPEYRNHVWSYDFVAERTTDGRPLRMLNIVDEYTRECLRIRIGRAVKATDVIYELSELFIERGAPDYLRSDNGSEFTADLIREWLGRVGVKTLFIESGSPWENGYIESFNGKLRDELLNGEIFDTILEARVITEEWRQLYNTIRPPMLEGRQKRTQHWHTHRGQVIDTGRRHGVLLFPYGSRKCGHFGDPTTHNLLSSLLLPAFCGERGIRTPKGLRPPVFKTGAIAVLPALRAVFPAIGSNIGSKSPYEIYETYVQLSSLHSPNVTALTPLPFLSCRTALDKLACRYSELPLMLSSTES